MTRGLFIVGGALILTRLVNGIFNGKVEPSMFMALFFLLTVKILIENVRTKKFIALSSTIQKTIRKKLHAAIFDHQSKPLGTGELLLVFFDAVASIDQFIVHVLPTVAALIVLTPLILIVAAAFDPMSALIFLLTLPIAPFLLYLIGRAVGARNEQAQTLLIKLNADFDELLRAIPTLKMFRQTQPAVERLQSVSERSTAAVLDVLKLAFVSAFALELITTLAIALVAVTCGLRLTAGALDFNAAFFILLMAPEFFTPIRQLGAAFHSFIDAKQSFERLRPLLTVDKNPRGTVEQMRVPPSITINNVSFTYPDKLTPVLENISLDIKAGSITVLKGESGCGKSTLLKLIAGINVPTVGDIFIDELPLAKMDRHSIVEKIAYVPQQPHHFRTSFVDNASLFQPIAPSTIKKYSRRRTVIIAAHRPAILNLADHIIDLDIIFDHDASS